MTDKRALDEGNLISQNTEFEISADEEIVPSAKKICLLVDKNSVNTVERKISDIITNKAVVVLLEDGCEVEISNVRGGNGGMKDDESEAVSKEIIEETIVDVEDIIYSGSPDTSDSVPGSSDDDYPDNLEMPLQDIDDDDGRGDFPLSGYPLVDRFPDLEHDLAEPDQDCGCCHCDMSDKKGNTTSEPDMVLYSDRTSDTIVPDCRYLMNRQCRDTGYNFWDVED